MAGAYKAAVVGLGRVGSGYPEDDYPRTHTGAYLRHPRTVLAACCDPSPEARAAHIARWGADVPVAASLEELALHGPFDAISVCVPPRELPGQVAEIVERCPPRVLFLEKPLAESKTDTEYLARLLNNSDVAVVVNYHRCYDPAHMRFFNALGAQGLPVGGRAAYSKGMYNYASHLVALLISRFGTVADVSLVSAGNMGLRDPSHSFILRFHAGFDVFFQGFDSVEYDLLELDLFLADEVFSLSAGGCRRRRLRPVQGLFYPGYPQLAEAKPGEPDGPVQGLMQAVENVVALLGDPTTPVGCPLHVGLEVLDVFEAVKGVCGKPSRRTQMNAASKERL